MLLRRVKQEKVQERVGQGTEGTGGARVPWQHMLFGKMVKWLEPNEQEIVCQDDRSADAQVPKA